MASTVRSPTLLNRVDALEQHACRALNRVSDRRFICALFRVVSRLGDGVFWYLLIPLLATSGADGQMAALQMAVAGLLGVLLYRSLKLRLCRERPYIACPGVRQEARALDRYSFPSGHTLQAVCLTTVTLAFFPALAWLLVPFTLLVAASRVVLGLHYPSDVLAGALIGYVLAEATLMAFGGF